MDVRSRYAGDPLWSSVPAHRGVLSARALLRMGQPSVVLVERDGSWSTGPAYATSELQHLLNVPAGKLSVDRDRPCDFVEWASPRDPRVTAGSFLPRSWYGAYLRASLEAAAGRGSTLTRLTAHVIAVDVDRRNGFDDVGVRVVLAGGRSIEASEVVLALGNPPSRPLRSDGAEIIDDPWSACADERIARDDSVVVVGSGLTAVDVALALTGRGHRGPLQMVSRHGLLPRAHEPGPGAALATLDRFFVPTARSAVSWLRSAIADAGGDWRAVFDAMRDDTNEIWLRLPDAERARLLRHVSRYWDVHRHRMAPAVATRVGELVASGRLRVCAGKVTGIARGTRELNAVSVRDAGGGRSTMTARWVINATGPNLDLRQSSEPLVRELLDTGAARPGPLGLGFDVSPEGLLVDGSGRASNSISVVGPLRRGAEWETTAIPDIRRQVEALAPRIVARRATPSHRYHGSAERPQHAATVKVN